MKILTKILVISFVLLFSNTGFAQLSGSYTIGGTSPKFTTISEAVDSLDTYGVSGAVILNIRSGTYTEQIVIDSIHGSSATNTITFQNDPINIILPKITTDTGSNQYPATINIIGSDFITFRGVAILNIHTGVTRSNLISLQGNSDYITVDSCILTGGIGSTIISGASGDTNLTNYLTVSKCEVDCKGNRFLSLPDQSGAFKEKGISILNNVIKHAAGTCISAYAQDSLKVIGNFIQFDSSEVLIQYGILANYSDHTAIKDNQIITNTTTKRAYGIALRGSGSASSKSKVTNNVYYNQSSSKSEEGGFWLISGTHLELHYNTFLVKSTNSSLGSCVLASGGSNSSFKNNLLVNTGGGYAIKIPTTNINLIADYNNLFTTGDSIASYAASNYKDLTSWISSTAFDSNSHNINPLFLSSDSLIPDNGILNNLGTAISGITTDINGTVRNTSTPDIGAYEFTGVIPPLAGPYSIGGLTPDYPTVDSAVADLISRGISDSVVFSIRQGTYSDSLIIGEWFNENDTNWVTFQPDTGNTSAVTISATLNVGSQLWGIDGSKRLKIKGLDFIASGAGDAIISFIDTSKHVTIEDCSFDGNMPHIVNKVDSKEYPSDSVSILNNEFKNNNQFKFTINLRGTAGANGIRIIDNTFDSCESAVELWSMNYFEFSGNTIRNVNIGLRLDGQNGFKIEKNYISTRSNGIALEFISGTSTKEINNNMIYSEYSSAIFTDHVSSGDISVNHNTFVSNSIGGAVLGYGSTYFGAPTINFDFTNNIINHKNGGQLWAIGRNASTFRYSGRNNAYYTSGDTLVTANDYTALTFANFQTQFSTDTNSLFKNPRFLANDSVFIPRILDLETAGTPIARITKDIRDSTRSTTTPSIGAYEYTYVCVGLSGVYTINPLGTGNRNFSSIKSAVDILNRLGICSNVIFNIKQGTYKEHINIDTIVNANDSTFVTFRNDPANTLPVLIKDSLTKDHPGLFTFKNTGYIKIIGLNFEEDGISVNTSSCIRLVGFCTDFYVDSCDFKGNTTTNGLFRSAIGTGQSHAEVSTDYPSGMNFQSERFEVRNSKIDGFGYPITISGSISSGIRVLNSVGKVVDCELLNVSNYSFFRGSLDTLVYTGNKVSGTTIPMQLVGNKSVTIENNVFLASGQTNHISFMTALLNQATQTDPIRIANNVFRAELPTIATDRVGFNIRVDDHYDFFNNTIYFETKYAGSTINKVFSIDDVKNLNIKNNNIYFNGADGYVYDLDRPSGHNYDLDYNNVYSASGAIGLLGGVEYSTLDSIRTLGYETNSLSIHPRFNNDTLLVPHVTELVDAGTPITGIISDILGVKRDTTPSVGAYEYTYVCAGLSGVYTIDSSKSASAINYTSITAAVDDLNSLGICDNVTFNIIKGTYNESILLNEIYNVGDSGRVVFQSDPSNLDTDTVLITNTIVGAGNGLVEISGKGYLSFKGIEFSGYSSSDDALTIAFKGSNEVTNIVFDSCTINSIGLRTINGSPSGIDSLVVNACTFNGGILVIRDNQQDSAYASFTNNTFTSSRDFMVIHFDVLKFSRNTVGYNWGTANAQSRISLIYSNNLEYSNNYHEHSTGANFHGVDIENSSNDPGIFNVYNNIFNLEHYTSEPASKTITGLTVNLGSNDSSFIYHNTIRLFRHTKGDNGYGVSLRTGNHTFKDNNVFVDFYGLAIQSTGSYTSSNNNLYTLKDTIAKVGSSYFETISQLNLSGYETNSVSIDPYFISDNLLRPYRASLDNMGITLTSVTKDFEDSTRASTPDIGAYEFDPIVFDVQVDSITVDTLCAGLFEVKALIKNLGDSTVKNIALNWTVSALSSLASLDSTSYYSGTLAKDSSAWVNLGKYNFVANTDYEIEVDADTIEGSQNFGYLDNTPENNFLADSFSIRAAPLANFFVQKACLSDSIILIPSGGIDYAWSGPNNFFSDTTDTLIRVLSDSNMIGAYTLTVIDSVGCRVDYTKTFALDSAITIDLPADDSICGSISFSLSANANTQYAYLWNNGETTPSIIIDSTFDYVVSVTDQNNCTNTDTFNLTVFDNPIVQFNSTIDAACAFGDSILLNQASPIGGLYSGTNVDSSVSKLGPGASGTYPVKYTYTDTNGCSGFLDTVVIVNKRPSVNLSFIADLCINEEPYYITENSPIDTISGVFEGVGIINDSIGIFDPAAAGTGTHEIYYTYTDLLTGCSSIDSSTITVNDTFNIAFTAAAYCINDGKVTLSKPSGIVSSYSSYYLDTNANDAVFGTHGFNPVIADTGNQTLKYTVVNDDNCKSVAYRDITVNDIPVVSLQLDTFCINAPSEIMSEGLPAGGTYYYGAGVDAGTYYPDSAGVGLDTVNYRFTQGNGCSDTAEAVFLIRQIPTVTFSLPSTKIERCIDAESFVFTGQSPVTSNTLGIGLFIGDGVDTNKFIAINAGAGVHSIQYRYTDRFGCADSAFDTIIVHTLPQPAFTTLFSRICQNQISDTVFATPIGSGGVFSGVGIDTAGFFNPSLVGNGLNKTLTYTFVDSNGCSDFVVDTFIIDTVPNITLALIPDQCENGDTLILTQGKFALGNFVYKSEKIGALTGGKFLPSLVADSIDNITYVFTDAIGCKDSLSQNIKIHDTTRVTFAIPASRAEICKNEATFNLSAATPSGGIYTGKGMVGNKFSPSNADLGNNYITYSYTNGDNCKSIITKKIKVNDITPVTFADQTFCLNDAIQTLSGGIPTSGIYMYSGGGMISDSVFVPSIAGVGSRTMTYTLTNSDGCISIASAIFTINSVPNTQFGAQSAICLNASEISLRNTSTSGDSSYFFNSNGLTNAAIGKYLPAQFGVGLDTLGYVGVKSSTGCADTIFNTILVNAIPLTTLDTFPDFCINNAPITVSNGNPKTGGTGVYSGKGIVGSQFYASIAKAGTHSIVYRFTDNNNCSTSDTEIVIVNALPKLTAVIFSDLCQFDSPITLTGVLPAGGFYSGVNVDSATAAFNPDSIGIWSISYNYVDTNGCENEIAQTQRVRALPLTQLNFSDKFCDNSAPIALNGGSPIGTGGAYGGQGVSGKVYDPALVTALIDTLVYRFIDSYGCKDTDTVFVSFDSSIAIKAIPLPDICKGTAALDLSVYFSPAGGIFKGANVFGSNFNANLLDTGRFSMSYAFTDSNNCTTSAKDTVVIRPLPDFQVSSDTGICQGDKIQLLATGNYSYDWNTGAYLSTIQVSPVKTLSYTVTATNSFNCAESKNIGITVFDQISVFTSSINATCDLANGSAFTAVAGGVKPYNYLWSTGQRTSSPRQLFAGNYQVTVNDKNGCTQYGVVGISNEDGPMVAITALVNNTCAGNENGEIEVSISSDTSYITQWNNGATGTKLTNLKSGIYELSVIGADGCNSFKSIEIMTPKPYEYQSIVERPDCDSVNGSVYLQLTNSLDSLTYNWVNEPVGDTLNNVGAGIYNVAITNDLGCFDTVTVSLNTANAPRIKLDSIHSADCSQNNGLLGISGIDPISRFKWSNGDTVAIIKNLAIGSYVITASDTNGCSTIEQFNIEAVNPEVPVICKVTNDSLLSANVLVWDTTGSAADSFYVYRESSVRNQYFKLAAIARTQTPRFVDNGFINSFSIGTYSVVAVDVCKNESEFSPVHKAILLTAKQTDSTLIELNWSNYQGSGFGDYFVYRYSSQFGLQLLDSINGINSYVDYNVPNKSSVLYYYVGIKGLTNCGDIGISTISNLSRDFGMKLVGVSSQVQEEVSFLVWPNPSNGSFQIKLTGLDTYGGQLIVYDMHGKIRYQNGIDSSLQGSTQSVILPEISSGLYYVQFIQNEIVITREIVVNR